MNPGERPGVAVFGSYDPADGSEGYATAQAVGRKLAELGYVVVNGGFGGTMEASARGARQAGGRTVGVICRPWGIRANDYTDRTVQTDSIQQRIAALLECGDAGVVVLPGSTGTLLELATVWEHVAKGLSAARPIVCVGPFWRPLVEIIASARPANARWLAFVESPAELGRHFSPVPASAAGRKDAE